MTKQQTNRKSVSLPTETRERFIALCKKNSCSVPALMKVILDGLESGEFSLDQEALIEARKIHPRPGIESAKRWVENQKWVMKIIKKAKEPCSIEYVIGSTELSRDQVWRMMTNLLESKKIKTTSVVPDFQMKPRPERPRAKA